MPTTLQLTLPWGRYHANPWGRSVNEAAIEWPPSTWRILRALFSSWKTRSPHLPADDVVSVLQALSGPPRYWLPEFTVAHTRHYLPGIAHLDGVKTDTAKTLDTFVVTWRDAAIVVEWPADLRERERGVLDELVAGIAYLGRAESIVDGRVSGDPPVGRGQWFEPAAETYEGSTTRVLAPELPLDVDALVRSPSQVRADRRLQPPATRWLSYPSPVASTPTAVIPAAPLRHWTAVRFAITGNALPPRRAAVALGDVLRRACIRKYDVSGEGRFSPAISGKDAGGAALEGPHEHAHFLAFARQASDSRRLDSLVVWAPGSLTDAELLAVTRCDVLKAPNNRQVEGLSGRVVRLGVEAFGDVATVAPQLVGPARRWISFTPYAPTRHRKGTVAEQLLRDVQDELAHRGLPAVVEIEIVRGDWLSYRRHRINESLRLARRAFGVQLHFDEPVAGPLALGQLSHFGLGLFIPDED